MMLMTTLLVWHNLTVSSITGAIPLVWFIGSELYLNRQ